jgi:UDP-N-acetylmuramate: L-alanyl-gamma-D-glutamyl-meso-diaminopimelate ligase
MKENKKESIYMMGICGTAMGSLAGLLKELGNEVRGSDQNVYPPMSTRLKNLGINIIEGYSPENLKPRPDKVIVGNVMSRTHSEVQALLQTDIPYISLPKAMGEYLIGGRHSVCVSGTHGKTTTTAIAAWVLDQAGLKPGFMIGGVPINFPQTFAVGEGKYFVIEGDEYDTAFFDKVPKFIHYKPRSVILTGIEFDHADIYKDLTAVKEAFTMLLKLIPKDGQLIYNAEDENIKDILESTKCKKIQGYGTKAGDWRIDNIQWGEEFSQFDVVFKGQKKETIESGLFGEYNLFNALSVYAMASNLGVDSGLIKNALKTFRGVKRRQEIIGKPQSITIIDDFAHHPTAVMVTIDGVRMKFPKSKIIAVFEPRSATSRRKIFQHDFAASLSKADSVIISEPYDQTKIAEADRFSSKELIEEIKFLKPKVSALLGTSVEAITQMLKAEAVPGNVILLMSNGGFGGIYDKLLKVLA